MVALRSQQQHICISSSTIRCVPDIWLASNKKECLINIIGIFVPVAVHKYAWNKKFPFAFIFSFCRSVSFYPFHFLLHICLFCFVFSLWSGPKNLCQKEVCKFHWKISSTKTKMLLRLAQMKFKIGWVIAIDRCCVPVGVGYCELKWMRASMCTCPLIQIHNILQFINKATSTFNSAKHELHNSIYFVLLFSFICCVIFFLMTHISTVCPSLFFFLLLLSKRTVLHVKIYVTPI